MASDIDMGGLDSSSSSDNPDLIRDVIEFCGGPDLIEVFGESGSGKSEFSTEVMASLLDSTDKEALFIDTERNIGDTDRIGDADYVYIPEWHDIYNYVAGNSGKISNDAFGENTTDSNVLEDGYDMIVLDSIGFPALVQYGEYRVEDDAEQFKVFNELQVITGKLKQYAQRNEALTIVTNQPKSELSGEPDPKPFGDKSIFGFKEVWKTSKVSTNEVATKCNVEAYRSRQAGKGKTLFEVKVDDSGVDVEDVSESSGEEWTA